MIASLSFCGISPCIADCHVDACQHASVKKSQRSTAYHREVGFTHLLRKPVDLSLCVAEDDGLGDGECVIQITQSVKLPVFLLYSNEELLDSFKGKFITLDQDPDGVCHEFRCHFEDIVWESSRKDDDLCLRWQVAVDIVDLLLETLVEKLICFVENEDLDVARAQVAALDHVDNSAWGTTDDVLAIVKLPHILSK